MIIMIILVNYFTLNDNYDLNKHIHTKIDKYVIHACIYGIIEHAHTYALIKSKRNNVMLKDID